MSASVILFGISGPNQGQMHRRLQGISCFKQKWSLQSQDHGLAVSTSI